jgi:phosphatidylethanolamine-binding protein (PEBP) family uncharacterized protein
MWNKICRVLIVVLAMSLIYGGTQCGSETKGAKPARLDVSSSAFQEGAMIPKLYTCDGKNVSPPLTWSSVPDRTQSIALICDDPDVWDFRALL